MSEILLYDFILPDGICWFWPRIRGLQSILDVCQAYSKLH